MNKTMIGGFVSVKSVLEAKSRDIFKIYIEKERFEKIMRSELRVPEQRQYNALIESGVEIQYVTPDEFSAIMPNPSAGGIAAEIGNRIFTPSEEIFSLKNGYIVILDGIEDPFNFAYALRSLYASGVDAVILPERNFFTASDTVIRSSAGASELIRACCVEDLTEACERLKSNGYQIVSTAKNNKSKDLYHAKLKKPLCLVFGGEKRGIKREILDRSDVCLKIKYPRDCHYSLPACNAISIIAFECARKISVPDRRNNDFGHRPNQKNF